MFSLFTKDKNVELTRLIFYVKLHGKGFPGGSELKAFACNVGDLGSIPGLGISPGEGNGNPLQYSCLENPKDGDACGLQSGGFAKSQIGLSDFTFTSDCMGSISNRW